MRNLSQKQLDVKHSDTATHSQTKKKDANMKSFLENGRASQKTWIKKKLLTIGTLNVRNIEINEAYVRILLRSRDILAKKRTGCFLSKWENIERNFVLHQTYSKAIDDNEPLPPKPNKHR